MASPFGPRWHKVGRDLVRSKVRTALVVLSIAVGVFAVGTIASTRIILGHDLDAAYRATNPASAVLFTSAFDDDLVRSVRHIEGIADAEGKRRGNVRVRLSENDWRGLRLEVRNDLASLRLNTVTLERGDWPTSRGDLVVERSSLEALRAKLGDTLVVESPNGRQHEVTLVGVVHDLDKEPTQLSSQVYGYISFDTWEMLGFSRRYSELHLLVSDQRMNAAHSRDVADQVKRKLELAGYTVNGVDVPPPGQHPASQILDTFLLILGILGGLSLVLSGFLVVNTVSAVLAQQVPQIGAMKAVGARTNQIMVMYLGTVLTYGILSLAVAVPLGGFAAYAFTSYLSWLLNFDSSAFRIPPQTLQLQILVALAVPLAAAFWPVFTGTRISVLQAISSYGGGRGVFGAGRFDRSLTRLTRAQGVLRAIPHPLLLSLRSTFRRKGRLALTLFTLTLGGAIFISVLTVQTSLARTLDNFLSYWRYDVGVGFADFHRVDQIAAEVMQVPGVVAAESWRFSGGRRVRDDGREGIQIQIVAPPAATRIIQPAIREGRWLLPGDTNALVLNSAAQKEESDLKLGDPVTLKINGRESTWQIVGIATTIIDGPTAYVDYDYFAGIVHSIDRANGVQVVAQQHDLASQNRLAFALKQRLDDAGLRVTSTNSIGTTRRNIEFQFNILVVFLLIMAVLLAVVGGLGLMGTMSINVLERSREIGVMRAIGASNGSVMQIFITEGLLIGALSWALGALLSLPISKLLSDFVGISFMRAPLLYTFSLTGAALWLAVVLVLAALASVLPSWRAARLTVREVLAYE